MSFGSILASHSNGDKRIIRSIESISRKIINNEAAVTFNEQCILNNLLPKYTNIKVHDEAVRRDGVTLDYRRNLVLLQIKQKTKTVDLLKRRLDEEKCKYNLLNIPDELRQSTDAALEQIVEAERKETEAGDLLRREAPEE